MEGIVFWQNITSPHQAGFFRALAKVRDLKIIVVVENGIAEREAGSGWRLPDFGEVEIILERNRSRWSRLGKRFSGKEWTHVFSGFGSYSLVDTVSRPLMLGGCRCGVMAETPTLFSTSFAGLRRWMLFLRDGIRALGRWRKIAFLLAMGQTGVDWYTHAGFPAHKVFPFAYFFEPGNGLTDDEPRRAKSGAYRIIYVGRLVRLKALDVLLKALGGLHDAPWRLDVVGDGPERENLERLSSHLGLGSRVSWHGLKENTTARRMISESQLLVLPSHYDGWGAVVNEALFSGVPAVATSSCGSSVAVAASCAGAVVSPGDVLGLRKALLALVTQGPVADEERKRIQRWAQCLSGSRGAAYFLSILKHLNGERPRPSPPWIEAVPATAHTNFSDDRRFDRDNSGPR